MRQSLCHGRHPNGLSDSIPSSSVLAKLVSWINKLPPTPTVLLLAAAKISLCFGRRNGVVPVTASPFQWLHVIFYCIDLPMIWHVLYLYHFMLNKSWLSLSLLKIRTICHARDLWNSARSCKQLRFLCPPEPLNFSGTALLGGFQSFEIHWVRQYLVNVVYLE